MEAFKTKETNGPSYLSPSQVLKFLKNPDDYYIDYMCGVKIQFKQNEAMALGSGFDAFVKARLYDELIGDGNQMFDLDTLYTSQVDAHMRDIVYEDSKFLMEEYVKSEAYSELMVDLNRAVEDPEFESDLRETIEWEGQAVPVRGKPDVFFWVGTKENKAPIILDFKVNGFYSASTTSPKPGYLRVKSTVPKKKKGMHKNCKVGTHYGVYYNKEGRLPKDWEAQLTMYGWLKGAFIDQPVLVGIEQLVNGPANGGVRIAQHRCLSQVGQQYWDACVDLWDRVTGKKEFFVDIPHWKIEDPDTHMEKLSAIANGMSSDLGQGGPSNGVRPGLN